MKNYFKRNGATYAAMIVIAATVAMPTYAQNQVSRLGYFEPAGKGSNNNQTSDEWELLTPTVGNGFYYGAPGDIPVVGRWTGFYYPGIGVFRPAGSAFNQTTSDQWLLRDSESPGNPDIVFSYGGAGDIPVVGDWTGSGRTTIGVYRPPGTIYNKTSQGEWLLRNSNTPGNPDIVSYLGDYASVPIVGDWEGVPI
jgi:hypothetical protein